MPKLTKRTVDAAKPSERRYFAWDNELKGFGLRVEPSGRKVYVLRYRNAHGRDRRMALAAHGALTPDQARQMAAGALLRVARGEDPLAERKALRRATSLADVAEVYRERHLPSRKPTTRAEYERQLKRHVLPAFGATPPEALTTEDVARWHTALTRKHGGYLANRCLALLRAMFTKGQAWGLVDRALVNPCGFVERFKERSRERFLDGDELARFGTALAEVERTDKRRRMAVAALRVLVLSGARRNEVLRLRWEELDREHACAWLSDERSKTGRRPLYLAGPCWEVLDGLQGDVPRREGWVFTSSRKRGYPLSDIRKTFQAACDLAKLDGLRLHDLRHTHASAAAGAGLSLPLIGALLGHATPTTTARYTHLVGSPVHQAAEVAQRRVADALAAEPKAPAGVRALKPRARGRRVQR